MSPLSNDNTWAELVHRINKWMERSPNEVSMQSVIIIKVKWVGALTFHLRSPLSHPQPPQLHRPIMTGTDWTRRLVRTWRTSMRSCLATMMCSWRPPQCPSGFAVAGDGAVVGQRQMRHCCMHRPSPFGSWWPFLISCASSVTAVVVVVLQIDVQWMPENCTSGDLLPSKVVVPP